MDFNVVEVLVAAALAYAALRGELAYRRWKAGEAFKASGRAPEPGPVFTVGYIEGAAKAVTCSKCGRETHNYFQYSDTDRWCPACDEAEA